VSDPGDAAEREADRVADAIMSVGEAADFEPGDRGTAPPATVQRAPDGAGNGDPMADGKPADPDAACLGCTPIAKVTKTLNGVTTVFAMCDDDFDKFNKGAGVVTVGPGCQAIAAPKGGMVNFRTGSPAWQVAAHVMDCTTPKPANPSAATPWELGFLQTLEYAYYGATYDNQKFTVVTNKDARDTLNPSATAPWYDAAGAPFGPQRYPTVPMLTDTPNVSFPVVHPSGMTDLLRGGCIMAKFNIWLAINRFGVKPSASNLDFLYHWSVRSFQTFTLAKGAHPCNQSQWTSAGNQVKTGGPGQGTETLVFSTPIATGNQKTDTTAPGAPCMTLPPSVLGSTEAPPADKGSSGTA
jgi:hypothetical protein